VNIARLPRLDVSRLAADYSAAVRERMTENQLARARELQAGEPLEYIDHAADYVDTADCMARAVYQQVPGSESLADYADEISAADARAKAAGWRLSRVLVACEYSGIVAEAFRARGCDAMSCDLLPAEHSGKHYRGDWRDVAGDGWHIMVGHPPCTYLTTSAEWAYKDNPGRRTRPEILIGAERRAARAEAVEFFRDMLDYSEIPARCLENPKGVISSRIRPPNQYVQPYEFGHDCSKTTGLWLEGLPELVKDPADYVAPRVIEYRGKQVKRWANQSPCGADRTGPSKDRGHKRSRFFAGIAAAMAEQWTGLRRLANWGPDTATVTAIGGE
jgi:hypothetical protein